MNIRELISNLLDYDMDATVEILVKSNEDSFDTNDFEIVENKFFSNSYVTLKVVPDSHVVVDEAGYEGLKEEKEQLDSLVEELKADIETLNEEIDNLESGE